MALSYRDARTEIMRAMQVVRELIKRSAGINVRERYLELFDALHRELAAIDSAALAQSSDQYRAVTLRFASSKTALENAHGNAQQIATALGAVAQLIQSLSKLAGAL